MEAIAYEGFSLQSFKPQIKRGITNVAVTEAGRLREWSQGELRL